MSIKKIFYDVDGVNDVERSVLLVVLEFCAKIIYNLFY